MRLPVRADQARTVYTEDDRQILETYVHEDLIICPLKEGRIDGNDRPETGGSHPGS